MRLTSSGFAYEGAYVCHSTDHVVLQAVLLGGCEVGVVLDGGVVGYGLLASLPVVGPCLIGVEACLA